MEIVNVTDQIIEVNVTNDIVNIQVQTGAYPLPNNVYSVFGRVGNVVATEGDYTLNQLSGVTIASPVSGQVLKYNGSSWVNSTEDNPVTSVFGRTGVVTAQTGDYNTDQVGEGLINQYYTNARARAAISENITGMEYSSASGIFSLTSGYVIPTQAMLDAKVPYTGATGDVNLGEHQLSAGQITFDQTPTGAAGVGVMRWNNSDGTLDLGLKGGNVTLQIGQETLYEIRNETGSIILNGTSVFANGVTAGSGRITAAPFVADGNTREVRYLGLATEDISNGVNGFVTYFGYVRNLDTRGTDVSSISVGDENWSVGDILYAHPTAPGKLTNVKPEHEIIVAIIITRHQNNGVLFVRPSSFGHLEDLHDVSITDPKIDGQGLFLETISGNQLWRNKTIAEALGYTPVTSARTISTTAPLTGGGDLSANRTLAITQAGASADGYLSSTDWNTFNNKQPLITAGTTAQYYRGDKTFQTLNTAAVPELTNLYYTDARARAAITGTAPISVVSGVVSISQASGSSNGYLSSTDWSTFNNKQAALNGTGFVKISGTTISYDNSTYLTTISGISAGGELSGTYANPSLVNSAVTGKVLTGLNLTPGGTIADTDTILGAFGKVQNQISALVGGVMYQGTWNASTNSPSITSSVGTKGHYYIVSVAGSTNINGITDWKVGDWIIFNGSTWDKVDNTDAVSSVNGYTGAVSLVTSDVAESGSLYFTNARAIGSTLTGYTSGAGTISSSDSILTAIQKLNGNIGSLVTGVSSVFGRTGAVTAQSGDYTTTQVTEGTNLYYTQSRFDTAFSGKTTTNLTEGTNLYYTDGRVSANADVSANTAARHAAVTLGTANGLSLSTQQLSLGLASSTTNGALSSTDWSTFNAKQSALTFGNLTETTSSVLTITGGSNAVIGSGTTIQVKQASGSQAGFLSAADWTTFNSKQNALTNPITGTGTTNTLPKFTGTSTIGNSNITDTGSLITLNSNSYINGGLGIGTSSLNGRNLLIDRTLTGLTVSISVFNISTIASDVTNTASSFRSSPSTQAAAFTLGTLNHFQATNATIGAGSSVTTQVGYSVSALSAATNNYGFRGQLASATDRWNLYMDGTAANYMAGKVGIGMTSGTGKVFIKQESAFLYEGLNVYASTNDAFVGIGHTGSLAVINSSYNSTAAYYPLAFNTSDTERMRITSGGNVGIGTSNPQMPLSVQANTGNGAIRLIGTSNASSNNAGIYWYDSNDSTFNGYLGNFSASFDIYNQRSTPMAFYTAGTERMRITSGGNVGIGTSSPAAKLEIREAPAGDWGISVTANTTTSQSYGGIVRGGTNSNDVSFRANNAANNSNYFTVRGDGAIFFLGSYPFTTGSGSNLWIDTSGVIQRNVSSIKYKKDVQDYDKGLAELMKLRPVSYLSKSDLDSPKRFAGMIAEELHELGFSEYVNLDEKGEPDSISYANMVTLLTKAIQELNAKVSALENKS
jgi:hypothetical protein